MYAPSIVSILRKTAPMTMDARRSMKCLNCTSIPLRSGKRTPRPTRITLTAVNFSPTSIKKQVADVCLALPLAHMSTLREMIHENVREGELYEKLDRNWVRCFACGHCCKIPDGQPGVCKVRYNRGGTLYVPWGYVGGIQCDPIEKKPFFHAHPGALAYSFGMLGCDLHC